jgi:hypothetical protein
MTIKNPDLRLPWIGVQRKGKHMDRLMAKTAGIRVSDFRDAEGQNEKHRLNEYSENRINGLISEIKHNKFFGTLVILH